MRPRAAPAAAPEAWSGRSGRAWPDHAEPNVTGPLRRGSGGSAASGPAQPSQAPAPHGDGRAAKACRGRAAEQPVPVPTPSLPAVSPAPAGTARVRPPSCRPRRRLAAAPRGFPAPGTAAAPRGRKAREPPRIRSCGSRGGSDTSG